REPPRARRRIHHRLRAIMPDRGHRVWRPERPGQPRLAAQARADRLHAAAGAEHAAENELFGDGEESEPGDEGVRRMLNGECSMLNVESPLDSTFNTQHSPVRPWLAQMTPNPRPRTSY